MKKFALIIGAFLGLVFIAAIFVAAGSWLFSTHRTVNWASYKVEDSMTNRLAMTQIVHQVATNHSLIADTNERMASISALVSTNGLVFAAYRSETGDITLQSHAVDTELSGHQVWISLEEPKSGKEPSKEYLAIKESVAAQCIQSFGKQFDMFGIDRE